jgi:CRP-like cAMP-binding protein
MGPFPPTTFLGSVEPDDIDEVVRAGRTASHRAGDRIMHEGGESSTVVFVTAGTVKLVKTALNGRTVLLDLRGPGDVIGELGAIDGEPRSASAVALEPVEVIVMGAQTFVDLTVSSPGLARATMATLVRRVRDSSDRQLEFGATDVIGRVCLRLDQLGVSQGRDTSDGILLDHAISQQELADWCGSSRDGVVRALGELRRLGWIATGRQRVLVVQPDQVRQRGASGG